MIPCLVGREVSVARGLMSDAEWGFVEPFIRAVRARQGRSAGDHRRVLDGVSWIARTGSAWRDLPEEFGKWSSVCRQAQCWTLAGLWAAVLEALNDGAARMEGVPPETGCG
jgi:transposase